MERPQGMPLLRGLVGAVVGGIIGYFVFFWLVSVGLYALALPGALIGLGFALLAWHRSPVYGLICAVLAAGFAIFLEWKFRPWLDNPSLGYFVTHLHELSFATLVMIFLSGLFGYWFGQGR